MARWECRNLGETTEFLGMYISHDHKNQKIFIDQCEYLEKVLACFNVVTNPTHTPLLSEFSFKPNEKQCDSKFRQKYQQLVGSLMYLMIGSVKDMWSGSRVTLEWKGFDNKMGTTLASACALCLDLLSRVWLHISGGRNCCQEFRRGMV